MYSQYKIIDVLAKKAGGPYALSSIVMKRARQILKGKVHAFGQEKNDPIQDAFEDFSKDALSIGAGENTAPEAQVQEGSETKDDS